MHGFDFVRRDLFWILVLGLIGLVIFLAGITASAP